MSRSTAHQLASSDGFLPLTTKETYQERMETPKKNGEDSVRSMENLPPEIRRHLLSTLNLPELKALVRSSTIFHQQYLFDQHYLLCQSLENTLGGLAVDAYVISGVVGNDALELLKPYSENTWRRPILLVGQLTENEATEMAAFYLHFVKPIAEHFSRWALDNLMKEIGQDGIGNEEDVALSRTEMMRLTRATYRFQLLSRLVNLDNWAGRNNGERSVEALFDILQPWEIEELYSFYHFAEELYDGILGRIHWDVHPQNPKFDDQGRPPTPIGAFDLDSLCRSDKASAVNVF